MQEVVINSELLAAYEEMIRCANIIKNEADRMEKDLGSISADCQLAILTIIFANKALDLEDIINIGQYVPKKIQSSVTEKDISKPLRQYVESSRNASFDGMNFYALELCYRNGISLETLNEIGHNFKYNPSQWGQRESKSSQMFVVELEEVQVQLEPEASDQFYGMKQEKENED